MALDAQLLVELSRRRAGIAAGGGEKKRESRHAEGRMTARVLTVSTLEGLGLGLGLGLFAFVCGTGSGVLGAKLLNLVLREKINPLLGSAGIASVPIAARVTASVALAEDPENYLIYYAMGPNIAGVLGTALSDGIMLALLH